MSENWLIKLGTKNMDVTLFFISVPYKNLSDKDKRTVNFVRRKIHGLTYQPLKAEHFQKPKVLGELIWDIYSMYKSCSNGERTVVGYKGGHVEKDLLTKLKIPCLNLKTLGCPKFDKLRHIIPKNTLLSSCGFYGDNNVHYFPVTESHAFWCWYKSFIAKHVPIHEKFFQLSIFCVIIDFREMWRSSYVFLTTRQ